MQMDTALHTVAASTRSIMRDRYQDCRTQNQIRSAEADASPMPLQSRQVDDALHMDTAYTGARICGCHSALTRSRAHQLKPDAPTRPTLSRQMYALPHTDNDYKNSPIETLPKPPTPITSTPLAVARRTCCHIRLDCWVHRVFMIEYRVVYGTRFIYDYTRLS